MIRVLITLKEEQKRKLKVLAGDNSSGFIQLVIDKLYEAKERQNASQPVQPQSICAVSGKNN
jgi:hypothetical protein